MSKPSAAAEGARLLDEGRLPEAVQAFTRGLDADPRDADCLLGLARARLAQGQGEHAEAEATLRRLLDVRPGHPEARSHLALLRATGGDESAVDALRAIAAEPGAGLFEHLNLGGILLERGDFAGAEAAYEAALRWNPDHPTALFERGRLALRRGDAGEAVKSLQRAARGWPPGDPLALAVLARAHAARGELAEALRAVREALQRTPELSALYEDLHALALRAGDAREALQAALTLRRMDPDSPRYVALHGAALRAAGQWAEARQVLEEGLAAHPAHPELNLDYALGLMDADGAAARHAARVAATSPHPAVRERAEQLLRRLDEEER